MTVTEDFTQTFPFERDTAPEAEDRAGFFDVIGPAIRTETAIGSVFSQETIDRSSSGSDVFGESDIDSLEPKYLPYTDAFFGVSKSQIPDVKKSLDREIQDRELLSNAGWLTQFAAIGAAQVVDPVNWIPVGGTAFKGASLGRKAYLGARAGAIGTAIQEPILQSTQDTRTLSEGIVNLGASAVIGSAIGAGAHLLNISKIEIGNPTQSESAPGRSAIHGQVYDGLVANGVDKRQAVANADIVASAYETIARRSGMNLEEFSKAYEFEVKSGKSPIPQVRIDGNDVKLKSNIDLAGSVVRSEPAGVSDFIAKVDQGVSSEVKTASGQSVAVSQRVLDDLSDVAKGDVSAIKDIVQSLDRVLQRAEVITDQAEKKQYAVAAATINGNDYPVVMELSKGSDDRFWPVSMNVSEPVKTEAKGLEIRDILGIDDKIKKAPDAKKPSVFELMVDDDKATFQNQVAGMFLGIMRDVDKKMGGKSDFSADLKSIRRWAGAKGDDFTPDVLEKFNKGFEDYLRTGKAPSPALKTAFEALKDWLRAVYANAADLDVEVSPEIARIYDDILVSDISNMPGAYPKSAGAAAVGDSAIFDPETGEYRPAISEDFALRNKFARFVEKTSLGLTPNDRAARSSLINAKTIMGNLVEDQRDTVASRQGLVGPAIETLLKNDRGLVEQNLYEIMGRNGKRHAHPNLTDDQFNRRIMDAIANPEKEGDEQIRDIADKLYTKIISPLEGKMRKIGMLADIQKWSKDGRYSPHTWSPERILANSSDFRSRMGARVNEALKLAYVDKAKGLSIRHDNILMEMSSIENGRLMRESEANSFGDRDLSSEELKSMILQARNKPSDKRPQSLRDFVTNSGGLWRGDLRGELANLDYKRPGFIRRDRRSGAMGAKVDGGRPLDEMRELAQEAGYLPEGSTVNDFIDALTEDVQGRRVYSLDDANEVSVWNAYDDLVDALYEMGIDPRKDVFVIGKESEKAVVIKAMKAADEIDSERIAALEEKRSDIEAEIEGIRDTLDSPDDLAVETDLIVDDLVSRLTQEERIYSDDFDVTVNIAGPLKRRSIDISRAEFSDFMDNDVVSVIGRHMNRMLAEYHLTNKFNRADMKYDIDRLRAEAQGQQETLSGKDAVRFQKDTEETVKMIQTTRDQLRGIHGKTQDGAVADASRVASSISYALYLGDVVTSSAGDMFRGVMAHGMSRFFRSGFRHLKSNLEWNQSNLGRYLSSERAGVVVERVSSARMMAALEMDDGFMPQSKASRFSNKLASMSSRLSLIDRWNQLWKNIATGLFMDRLGEMSSLKWSELSKADRNYLSTLRISEYAWEPMRQSLKKHGFRDRGVFIANTENWEDARLKEIFRAAMRKDADSIIITPGFGDRIQRIGGADLTHPLAKTALQFKSFWISGQQRGLLRAAQNPDVAATMSGMMMMVAMGMAVDWIKSKTGGYELSDNIGTRVMGGIDRAGIIPLWLEANNVIERGTSLPLAYRSAGALGTLAGSNSPGNIATRYQNRNVLGSFAGPSAGALGDALQFTGDINRAIFGGETIKPSTVTTGGRLLPFQNVPPVRLLMNLWAEPALKDMLE